MLVGCVSGGRLWGITIWEGGTASSAGHLSGLWGLGVFGFGGYLEVHG